MYAATDVNSLFSKKVNSLSYTIQMHCEAQVKVQISFRDRQGVWLILLEVICVSLHVTSN